MIIRRASRATSNILEATLVRGSFEEQYVVLLRDKIEHLATQTTFVMPELISQSL
jgi:hypothetical protein